MPLRDLLVAAAVLAWSGRSPEALACDPSAARKGPEDLNSEAKRLARGGDRPAAQVRRAALLEILAKHAWNPKETALALGVSAVELQRLLYRADLGDVLSARSE